MSDYQGRRRRSGDGTGDDPDATSWIDLGPLADEEEAQATSGYGAAPSGYDEPTRQYDAPRTPPHEPAYGDPGYRDPAGPPPGPYDDSGGMPPPAEPRGEGRPRPRPRPRPEPPSDYPPPPGEPAAAGYEVPPRRYSTSDRHYRDEPPAPPGDDYLGLDYPGQAYRPRDARAEQPRGYPPDDEPTHGFAAQDEPTRGYPPHDEPTRGYPPQDEPTRGYPPHDEPTRGYPPPGEPPPLGYPPPRGFAADDEPTGPLRPADPDATTLIPSLRDAPMAPPTPVPQLRFEAADATMLMSAVPYFAPSATPAYTGTIYTSYAASRSQMEDEEAAKPPAEREAGAKSVARNSAVMALGSVVSRLTGFLRTAVLAATVGVVVGDTYTTANTVPSMVYELLLGGILTSVLVPLLVRAKENDPDRGLAFMQRLLTLAVIALGAATVLAVASAPLFTAVMSGDNHGPAERELMTSLAYLLLPEVFFFGIAGILAAVLNSRGHFGAPMWTPILNNVVVIGTFVVFALISPPRLPTAETMTSGQIMVLGVGTTLGIVVQACGLIPALRRVGFRWRWRFDFRELHLSELGRVAGWMACYVAVSQIGVVIIVKLAYAAGGVGAAGPLIYNQAFLLFMMAHGIVAVSIITALMPRMSAAAANQRHREVVRNISLGTRLTSVVLMPVTVAYLVLGTPITSALFVWGKYTEANARAAGLVVAVAGLGLVPFAISQLQTFAFYALTETRTAALINIPVVATKVVVDIALFYMLPAKYVAAGLMFGNLCSYALGAVISARMLRSRLGPMGQGEVFRTLVRLALAGLAGGLACLAVLWVLNLGLGDGKGSQFARVIVGGLVLVLAYLGAAWAMRVREISDVVEMIDRKLGGRLPLPRRRATAPDGPARRGPRDDYPREHPDYPPHDEPPPPPRSRGTVYGRGARPRRPRRYRDDPHDR